ncbi:hypothetical protein [Salinispora vitiensis]|uniref:hypothetical protein n=1 Tax=Salinispora vitiensis TaxID=999544 RepID=UPI00037076CA|nr:hypothetical protein [Salinispora vitiensis]
MFRRLGSDPLTGQVVVMLGVTVGEMRELADEAAFSVSEMVNVGDHPTSFAGLKVVLVSASSEAELQQRFEVLAGLADMRLADRCGECDSCRGVATAARAVVAEAEQVARKASEQ